MQIRKLTFILVLFYSIIISGCISTSGFGKSEASKEESVEKAKTETKSTINEIVKYNRDSSLPPLDLSKQKSIAYKIFKDSNGVVNVIMSYDDYVVLLEGMKKLENRIEEQGYQIDNIIEFYGKQLD